jgi:hypothetical protein
MTDPAQAADAPPRVLSRRELNRSLLARQMLLVRARMPIEPAVRHLVGLQAQRPDPPHIGLWSRLFGIRHTDIDDLIDRRRLLRVAAMRATIHLLTVDDALGLRPVIQPALDRELSAPVFKSLRRVKLNAVVARGRELCREQPLTFAALGECLAREFPAGDPHALAIAVRNHVALAQVPPRGRWRTAAPTVHVPVADWLGSPMSTDPDPAPLVLRYLAAFGPATAADIATWSGLRGIKVLLEQLGDQVCWLTDDRGRTLVDVPGGILPDPDVPAPVRLLPEYDNALLSHADRTRIIEDGDRPFVFTRNGHVGGTVLVDGYVRATWRTVIERDTETLTVRPLRRLTGSQCSDIEREALALLAFASPQLDHRLEFEPSA